MFLGIPEEEMDEDDFRKKMTRFLFGSVGSKHRLLLSYDDEIICGEPAPAINVNIVGLYRCITNTPHMLQMSMIQFTHRLMSGPKEQIPAMNRVKKILADANFSSRVFPMCIGYASWETDEVISEELYRNILLAILCVFITTWMLLFNFGASLQVCCVMPQSPIYCIIFVEGAGLCGSHSGQRGRIHTFLGPHHRHRVLH